MLNPDPATPTASDVVCGRLTAHAEEHADGGVFCEPVDVSLLEDLQIDEAGRRGRWLPTDLLL